jgi:hypothetical protein
MYVMVVVQKIKPDFEEFHFFLWRFFISLFGNHDMSNHTLNTSYVIRKIIIKMLDGEAGYRLFDIFNGA